MSLGSIITYRHIIEIQVKSIEGEVLKKLKTSIRKKLSMRGINKMTDSSNDKTLQDHLSQAPAPSNVKKENEGKILVVEDDKFLRELLVRKLFNSGFEVESDIDATGTFNILESWMPDIILLDLILPGEDGFFVLEKLKKDKKFASVPVIILSNLGQQEDVDKAMALGAIDFMVKANFTLDEIIEKVNKAINLK